MDFHQRIESGLKRAISSVGSGSQPKVLTRALHYAVFPGGRRLRPRLCHAVAATCGARHPDAADAVSTAIELLHCASLVHDDLPCFDDARTRRGKPSVHKAFGERTAVLAGDALVVLAFETIARECASTPALVGPLISAIAEGTGMPRGIIAGQAWELEDDIPLQSYHRSKTGGLFGSATAAGAIAGGAVPESWREFGEELGIAYQIADDLHDVIGNSRELGKPRHQDAKNRRPNAATLLGTTEAIRLFKGHWEAAVNMIPCTADATYLKQMICEEAVRVLPSSLAQHAA